MCLQRELAEIKKKKIAMIADEKVRLGQEKVRLGQEKDVENADKDGG